jgi:hypothetical protein
MADTEDTDGVLTQWVVRKGRIDRADSFSKEAGVRGWL